ncbi:hypothetical protein LSAT2_011873 [Lamellibrachia satsuma]|nr:hypothetical protein LSAT2_011873 [Lamellibrachia satsuma]
MSESVSAVSCVSSGTSQQVRSSSSSLQQSTFSSSSSSSSSRQEMASYSSKTVSSKTTKTTMSSKSVGKKMSSTVSINSSSTNYSDLLGDRLGIDVDSEMAKLKSEMKSEMGQLGAGSMRQEVLRLMSLEKSDSPNELVKLDSSSLERYLDDAHKDKLRFNLDVNEFESESVSVKTVGNKIEVHAMKRAKKGDQESSEEYSRTYELPTPDDVDPGKVTSSFYKDGVLTLEIPVKAAVGESTTESIEAK